MVDTGSGSPPEPVDLLERVRGLCASMPQVTEAPTHGAPTWFVNGRRSFAKFVDPAAYRFGERSIDEPSVDERSVDVWAAAPDGARQELVAADPDRFFEPPFGGARWVGMRPGPGTDWREVGEILDDAYRQVAPRHLIDRLADRPVTER